MGKKSIPKKELIRMVESDGELLEEYPTDSWGGSNTGDAQVFSYMENVYEIDKESDGNRVRIGKISSLKNYERNHK
jgi:hypothetical protein